MTGRQQFLFLSLGWGVQSFTLAAMSALGDLPKVDIAIHADTTHEAAGTYRHAAAWTPWLKKRGIEVVTVHPTTTSLDRSFGVRSVSIPAFTVSAADGSKGQIKRQCTTEWKIRPIRRHIRERLGRRKLKAGAVACWQGISLDEADRMRSSDVRYITNVYPLVDARMTRQDCVEYLIRKGLDVPPKSSCVFCPFHKIQSWKEMKAGIPEDWERAVAADQAIRSMRERSGFSMFVHPHRRPLEEAVRIPGELDSQLELIPSCDGGVCFV